MKFFIALFSFLFLKFSMANGQVTDSLQKQSRRPENKWGTVFSVTPHYLLVDCIKSDVDIQINRSPFWGIASINFFPGKSQAWRDRAEVMQSFGATLSLRYYLLEEQLPKNIYLQAGVVCNYSEVYFHGYDWIPALFNGLDAYEYDYIEGPEDVLQYGFDLIFGFSAKSNRVLLWDFYGGIGKREIPNERNYTEENSLPPVDLVYNSLSPVYEGMILLIGIRVGVNL